MLSVGGERGEVRGESECEGGILSGGVREVEIEGGMSESEGED